MFLQKENLDLAFKTGEDVGISATLSADDMLKADGPDWQRVLSYVESIFRHFEMWKLSSLVSCTSAWFFSIVVTRAEKLKNTFHHKREHCSWWAQQYQTFLILCISKLSPSYRKWFLADTQTEEIKQHFSLWFFFFLLLFFYTHRSNTGPEWLPGDYAQDTKRFVRF